MIGKMFLVRLLSTGAAFAAAAVLAAPPQFPAPNPAGGGALGGNGLPIGTLNPTGATFTTPGALNNNAGVSGTLPFGAGSVNGSGQWVAAPGSGIWGTPHDFASGFGAHTATQAVGLCTFCHTPHKGLTTLLLWNHKLSANTFQWDVASTTSGTALPGFTGSTYAGPSAKCLSCHDGSVAVGDINWFKEQNWHTTPLDGKFAAANSRTVGYGGALGGQVFAVGPTGAQIPVFSNNTHPVAIPYPLNGAPNVYNGSVTGANLATNDFQADPTANNMRLYSDVGGGVITGKVTPGKTGIECSTCHDPHNRAANDNYFLRGKLVGATKASGYICLQCHVK